MKISISGSILKILALLIAMTPLLNLWEVHALIVGTLSSQSEALTPVYIKILKDVGLFLVLVLSFLLFLSKKGLFFSQLVFVPWLLIGVAAFVFSATVPWAVKLVGVRWFIPVLVMVFLIGIFDESQFRKLVIILLVVFFLHVFLQVIQMFFGMPWYGIGPMGLSLRNPGLFLIPSTGALFSVIAGVYFHFYWKSGVVMWGCCFFSVIMTASITGLAALSLILVYLFARRYVSIAASLCLVLLMLFSGMVLVNEVIAFLGRGADVLAISGGERVRIFNELYSASSLISNTFGLATNAGILWAKKAGIDAPVFVADSTYASVLSNLGYSGFAIFIAMLSGFLFLGVWRRSDLGVVLAIFVIAASFGAILFEVFPVNLLIMIGVALFLSNKSGERFKIKGQVSNKCCLSSC